VRVGFQIAGAAVWPTTPPAWRASDGNPRDATGLAHPLIEAARSRQAG
jgi:hypothetical protein